MRCWEADRFQRRRSGRRLRAAWSGAGSALRRSARGGRRGSDGRGRPRWGKTPRTSARRLASLARGASGFALRRLARPWAGKPMSARASAALSSLGVARQRAGSDAVSIHAPAKGATTAPTASRPGSSCFNPRPREGGDAPAHLAVAAARVSLHAPAKGARPACASEIASFTALQPAALQAARKVGPEDLRLRRADAQADAQASDGPTISRRPPAATARAIRADSVPAEPGRPLCIIVLSRYPDHQTILSGWISL